MSKTTYEQFREAILNAASPEHKAEILELKFGCKIIKTYFTEVKYEVLGWREEEDIILSVSDYYDTGKGYKTNCPKGVKTVRLLHHNGNIFTAEDKDFNLLSVNEVLGLINSSRVVKIIGRDLTKSDVECVLLNKFGNTESIKQDGDGEMFIGTKSCGVWKLPLPAHQQSDETLLSIINLLK